MPISTPIEKAKTHQTKHVLPAIKHIINRVEYDEWITAKEAATILRCSLSRVRVLREEWDPITRKPYLQSWKVNAHLTLVKTQSVIDHLRATQADPEFWAVRRARSASFRR